jgi:transporter family protein
VTSAAVFGLLTMIAWGFWIVFGNVASNTIDPKFAAFLTYLTAAVVTGLYLLVTDVSFAVTNRGLLFAAAAGIAAAIGVVATFVGVTVGPTSVVATIGGMYFVTAAVISIVALGESVSVTKVAGIGLALGAVVLLNQ